MELNEQNDDEMILVVVRDDHGTKNNKTSKGSDHSDSMPVPNSVKIEPIEDIKGLYCTEDVRDIFPINVSDDLELIEIKPDIEVLDEEFLQQEDYLEEGNDYSDTKTIKLQEKRKPRKTSHKYLIDEEVVHISPKIKKRKTNVISSQRRKRKTNVISSQKRRRKTNVISSQKRKRKTNVAAKKSTVKEETVLDEEDFFEVEFLDDDIASPKRVSNTASDEEFLEIEYLDDSPKSNKKNTSSKKKSLKIEEDEEYLPDEEETEEYVPPKRMKKKQKNRKNTFKGKKKTEKPAIRSIISELRKKHPLFAENKEKLVEYIANLMRKRIPPAPLPNSYLPKGDEYTCSYCDVDCPTLAAARRHYQASHGPRYLVCYACGDDFRSVANLYKHEKRCRAPDADIQLRARGVFLGRKGRSRPYLTKNKYIPKTPEKPNVPKEKLTKFYCPHCPAVYCRNGLLKEHMAKHIGFRPFQCHECPAAYVSRHQLNKHAKKHSDDQFICDHCGKVLKMKTSLISHMDTHLPRPRFGCGECGRRYSQRSAVKVHIMRDHMHLPPPAACPICPKRYNRMSHVKSHMKKDHGLILMTKNTILRNLPYMKLEDLEGAKIVFNSNESKLIDLNPEEKVILPDLKIEEDTILQ